MNEKDKNEPKIIVDDDWKSQVESEKEKLQQQFETESAPEMPPASFSILLTTLASQAMASLGQLPDPVSGTAIINKPLAKHFIDTIGVLEEKTKGNLTEDETAMVTNILHQLRMVFVATPDQLPDAESAAKDDQPKSSTIELP
jgi:hypothetical protein